MKPETASPRLRRAYFECRHGQLHVHNAIPAGGGFDEQTTLLCLHGAESTGRSFLELSRQLGALRSVYSPDLPGCGESDAPADSPSMAEYAEAIADFVDSMRFRQLDLLGVHAGAALAAELALARPKVIRKVMLIGAPLLDDTERRSWRDLAAPESLPAGARRVRGAMVEWRGAERLPLVRQPLLVLRPKDSFWDAGGRVARLVPGARVVDLPEEDLRVVEKSPALVAKQAAAFFGS